MNDLTQLTRFEGRLTFLYLEKGHVEQHQRSVAYVTEYEKAPISAASRGGACLQAWSSPGEQGFVIRRSAEASRKIVDLQRLHLVAIPTPTT